MKKINENGFWEDVESIRKRAKERALNEFECKSTGERFKNTDTGYKKYLHSEHWKQIKTQFKIQESYTGKCYICGNVNDGGFHLHHKTYERIGNEEMNDLELMCKTCHFGYHEYVNEMRIKEFMEKTYKESKTLDQYRGYLKYQEYNRVLQEKRQERKKQVILRKRIKR